MRRKTAGIPAWAGPSLIALLLLWPGVRLAAQSMADQDLMSLSIEELAKAKVFSASRHLEDSRQAPASVTVITAEEIERYGWRTLADVLRSVRGFYTSYDRTYSYLGVRGFMRPGDYNSRILLMIDGHRTNDNVYDGAQFGTEFPLDLDVIDHIEIVRGASSSLFGTNAIFGVINVITRQPGKLGVEISGDTGSFFERGATLTTNFKKGRMAGLASGSLQGIAGASHLFFPEFDTPQTNGGIAENVDGESSGHAFADLQYGNFRFEGLWGRRSKLIPTASYETNFNDPTNQVTDSRAFLEASYHRQASLGDLDVRLYYDWYDLFGEGAFGGTDPATHYLGQTWARADWLGTEATLGRKVGRHRLIFGANYEHSIQVAQRNQVVGLPALFDNSIRPWLAAVYGEAELNLIPKVSVRAGTRMDYFDAYGASLSPRIAVVYSPNSRTALKYIFSRAFRAPNAYESNYADNVVIEPPMVSLKPETSIAQELIFERGLSPWLEMTVDGSYSHLSNLIDQVSDPNTGLSRFVNIEQDRGRVVEFELQAKRGSGLTVRTSYTLAQAANDPAHVRLANSPLHLAKVNGTVPLSHRTFAGLELLYSSAQMSYQDTRIPSSFLTNVTFSTRALWKQWQFSASCYNLFDRRWFSPAGPELRQTEIRQDDRTFRVKVTYRWNRENK